MIPSRLLPILSRCVFDEFHRCSVLCLLGNISITEGPSCSQLMFNEIHGDVRTRNVLPKLICRVANDLVSSIKLVCIGLSI